MNILVINCGSSSLKYQLINMCGEQTMAKGLIERIGLPESLLSYKSRDKTVAEFVQVQDHHQAMKLVLDILMNQEDKVINDLKDITVVGHRVVHGGEKFSCSTILTPEIIGEIERFNYLAPLHNPQNIIGIRACQEILSGVPQVAVFDTAFHQTVPPEAFLYGLPYEYYQSFGIRRYGFHGMSHRYVAGRAAELMGRLSKELKLITCHLGNGVSISAVQGGLSVDNSMGFTPLEGVPMGTRCGNLDPGIICFLMQKQGLTLDEITALLNRKCGILGISGMSNDFREVQAAAEQGNEQARLALKVFIYSVKKYIGAYSAILNGFDGLVFTAGIGENSPEIRSEICQGLEYLGIVLDQEKNKIIGQDIDVTDKQSKVKVMVISTNEEVMIAREAYQCVSTTTVEQKAKQV